MRARDLYRFYRTDDEETLALRGVSLGVAEGEVVVVAGPSGSGKSTLLACLAGLDEPSGGTVWVAGRRLSHRPEPERAALRASQIGVLRQHGNLIEHLSVTDNIALARRLGPIRGRRARCPRVAVPELLDAVGLTGRAHALPSQLSGGESTRAGLAVALANDPAVLLADEPTGELDSDTEALVLLLLRARARAGTAILVASHSSAVAAAADRVLRLADGRVTA